MDKDYLSKEVHIVEYQEYILDDYDKLLASLLKNIKAKFMLSYNDCALIRELYKDFNFKELKVKYSLYSAKQRKESTELLIMNF